MSNLDAELAASILDSLVPDRLEPCIDGLAQGRVVRADGPVGDHVRARVAVYEVKIQACGLGIRTERVPGEEQEQCLLVGVMHRDLEVVPVILALVATFLVSDADNRAFCECGVGDVADHAVFGADAVVQGWRAGQQVSHGHGVSLRPVRAGGSVPRP